jgi:nucleotide-binding universal stress UspA family protein
VLVGVDETPGARAALEWAVNQASLTGAEVLAVHVLTYSRELANDLSSEGATSWRRRQHEALEGAWTEPLHDSGVPFRTILTEDDHVDRGLLRVADEQDAGLIVVGRHGRGGWADRVLGSATYKVAHRAQRPVVIVPEPD